MAAVAVKKLSSVSQILYHRGFVDYSLLRFGGCSINICRSAGGNIIKKTENDLWDEYTIRKSYCENFATQAASDFAMDPKSVFANNEVDLSTIDVYGFDYDYTLACYTCELHHLIYKEALEDLVNRRKFPPGIKDMKYNLNFGIRGLHFDTKKGLLMKVDAFHHIQLGTVYRGLQKLPDTEVLQLYGGTHVPEDTILSLHGQNYFKQLIDLFSIPEMTLLANVIEHLEMLEIPYDPEYLFYDIHNAVKEVHVSGNMHREVGNNVGTYLESPSDVRQLISRLYNKGKQLFLITNSPFEFVDKGMSYMIGNDWVDYFEVIVVQARKPLFFKDTTRPFRFIYPKTGTPAWARVKQLRKGEYYLEGNVQQFTELTGWDGARVLYFGDHIYSDLADPSLTNGWRTGGIIPELEEEIEIGNSVSYKRSFLWLMALQNLIEDNQDTDYEDVIDEWMRERSKLRIATKEEFNHQFGSIFRTYHNPSFFTSRLCRYADLYMSSVSNLLQYPTNHTFYPRRSALPHENNFNTTIR